MRSIEFVPRGRHLFVYDVAAVGLSVLAAFGLRFDANDVFSHIAPYMPTAVLPIVIMPPVFVAFGLYRREWRYASVNEMFAIAAAVLVGTGITFAAELMLGALGVSGTSGFPRSIFVIEALLIVALVGGGRFTVRAGLERRSKSIGGDEEFGSLRTLVYGAGEVGATVARVAARDPEAALTIVGFLDDDSNKHGNRFLGKTVFGGLEALDEAIRRSRAQQLLLAMPQASGAVIRRAFEAGRAGGLVVRTVPPPRDLLNGEVQLSTVRNVSLEDLLRREPVAIDLEAVTGYLNGANVLVTGGGGSIGSELIRQILVLGPRQLTVLDNHEAALWEIESELGERARAMPGLQFRAVLADVRSLPAVEAVVRDARPDVVFHAAALKHVPIVELHPSEGVMTNVVGTHNTLLACERSSVPRFVLISTDKAVDPVGAMGATKRMAEHLTILFAQRTGRPYVAVRFGNVLGSSGSVIPTFQRQLAEGHPLTITHPDATRYFMTIGEAVSLILEAASSPASGEVYVLDMGEPVRILDLAKDLIRLTGLEPERVPITFTGLRAGERLHETLFHDHETTEETIHRGILRVRPTVANVSVEATVRLAALLETAARDRDDRAVRTLLREVHLVGLPSQTEAEASQAATPP
ncbi:MAG TPA: nucleoside-diphosphate sugar epimerase/dehydratase [Candidatus Limnocylindrales bacterium]|jgi:FlaA1/EpsC-like NDP-sugar epimerase